MRRIKGIQERAGSAEQQKITWLLNNVHSSRQGEQGLVSPLEEVACVFNSSGFSSTLYECGPHAFYSLWLSASGLF